MDPVTVGYYAIICATLGAAAPRMGRLSVRLVLGAVVGLIAAAALPWLRMTVSY